ncbi:B3 domain-containing protein At4g34400-like [Solanum dulcamara]|uniref:B3 domain-containing protein At4g34400-like n=1 Tax=Solanum dulcamara TaxID=45834 RepID=UPI002486250E|nr:B3 domain-containing protein At4g34400-like [Solanum dulcamara]
MWPIGVIQTGRDFYFQYGWEKFIEENIIEFGDFLIFEYDGKETFHFKLLGINGCENKGFGGENKEEEMNIEHRKSVEPKGKKWASDSSSSSSDDDSAENYMVEEENDDDEEEEEEEVKKEEKEKTKNVSCSKHNYMEEEEYKEEEGEEEETEEEEDEEENEKVGTFNKKASHSKVGCQKATAGKVRYVPDHYGADIFKSGRTTQPKNPYFVEKIRTKRRDQLFVPIDVVRDYKLKLPPIMIIRDSVGREFETRVNNWKDDRIWLVGGWRNLCKWNLVEKDDKCICEFVRGKFGKDIYLQVQVLYEGSSFHPNNK